MPNAPSCASAARPRPNARRAEQDLANLYYRSGWLQEHLAKKEGKSQNWISIDSCSGAF